jgi:hypothetical protein
MAPPNDKKIISALRAATLEIFNTNRDGLTVKAVRNRAAVGLDVDPSFFVDDGEWKVKSKECIKGYAVSRYILLALLSL